MDDLSNKTLAALLVIAVVVSLAGTFVSLDKVGRLRLGLYATGFGTVGNVTVTIAEAVVANLTDDTVAFSNGNVIAGEPYAYMDTNGNNTNWNGAATQDGMEVRNEGNVKLNITIRLSDAPFGKNASRFLCDGQNFPVTCGVNASFLPNFSFWAEQNESNGSLGNAASCGAPVLAAGTFLRGGNRTVPRELAFNASGVAIEYVTCENLSPSEGQDEFVLEFAVRIPSDATGVKNNTITITARSTS